MYGVIMVKIDIKLLEELSNAFGPSGFELDVQRILKKKQWKEILFPE